MGRGRAAYGIAHEAALAAEAKRVEAWIDARLFEELSVVDIAEGCGLSAFHFSRRFSRQRGESVMAYVRGRRLEVAAARLATDRDARISSIALECGFASQAAFTRAFTRSFGQPPGAIVQSGRIPVRKRRSPMIAQPMLTETTQQRDPILIAGLAGRFEPSTYVDVAGLWKRAVAQFSFVGRIAETVGVFRNRDPAAGTFEHMAGVFVPRDATLPEGFVRWEIPAGRWIVFRQALTEEPLHLQVMAAEYEIRTHRLPRGGHELADAPDFQLYPADFRLGGGGWLEHWLPSRP